MNTKIKWVDLTLPALLFSLVLITLGSFIYAIGVNSFVIPNHLGNGGVSGIALIFYYLKDIQPGTTNFILNSALLLIGYRFLEKRMLILTIYAMLTTSYFLNTAIFFTFESDNILISAIAAGVLMGAGIGLILRGNGSSAGFDIIALILKKYIGLNFSTGSLLLNTIVIFGSIYAIGVENMIVTLGMKYVSSIVIQALTDGLDHRRQVMIITDHEEEVAQAITDKVGRGITFLHSYGYYSKKERNMLLIIVNRGQVLQLQRTIMEIDPKAFITISDIQQVIGQGFTFYNPTNRNKRFYSE